MKKSQKAIEVELQPDAWLRFERFIRDIAKAGPQHRAAKANEKRGKSRPSKSDDKQEIKGDAS